MYCLDAKLWESEADHQRKEWLHLFFCVFDVLLVFSGFRGGRTWVNGGTVNFTTPPSTSLSLSVSHSRSLSLIWLCQTTVSIAVCLPSSKNHLVGNLRHTHSHTNTHTFPPRVRHGAEGHDPGSLPAPLQWKHLFPQKNISALVREPLSLTQWSKLVESAH